MVKKTSGARRTMTASTKNGAVVRSAESRRMAGLSAIPTVERRNRAIETLLKRAK